MDSINYYIVELYTKSDLENEYNVIQERFREFEHKLIILSNKHYINEIRESRKWINIMNKYGLYNNIYSIILLFTTTFLILYFLSYYHNLLIYIVSRKNYFP